MDKLAFFRPHYLAEPLSDVMSPEELAAVRLVRTEIGVDVLRTFQFWEAIVARLTTGELTDHQCPWDVELDYFGTPIRIEVKFAKEMNCLFQSGRRRVFKFALPKGGGAEKPSHVTVLAGIDARDDVHTWVIPSAKIPQSASITLISPNERTSRSARAWLDSYHCPMTQILPEVLRAWRAHLELVPTDPSASEPRQRRLFK